MNKFLLLGIIIPLNLCFFAQNVVKVGSKHNKKLIYTLKEGENITRGESRINLKSDGIGYEFCIQTKDYKYMLYKDGISLGEYQYYTFSNDDYQNKVIYKNDEKLIQFTLKNGKKYGPYHSVNPIYGNKNNSEITGINYKINNDKYINCFLTNKIYGPFKETYINKMNTNELIFTYKNDDGEYLVYNDKTYGPFADCKTPYYTNDQDKSNPFFYFLDENQNWKINFKGNVLAYNFQTSPELTLLSNGIYFIKGNLKDDDSDDIVYFIMDQKIDQKNNKIEPIFNSFGEYLTNEYSDNKKNWKSGLKIYHNNKFLGIYEQKFISESRCYNSKTFQFIFTDTTNNKEKEAFIYKNEQFISIGKVNDIEFYSFHLVNDDYYYIRKSDSTLIKNGIPTSHRGVTNFEIKKFPNEIFMIKNNGKNDVFLYNGVELSSEEIRKLGYYPEAYNLKDKQIQFETKDGKSYVFAKGSSKKYGPVGRYNDFFFSKNNAHLAECNNRRMEIFIDNKLFSSGFSLNFNPKTNNFHWFSIEDNKLYLHTYNNN